MKLPGKRASTSDNSPRSKPSADAQSEETLRARARRRLIGAVVLVMTGVVVFPLIFETSPKPVASTMNLVIPPQSQASAVLPIRAASPPSAPASHPASAAAVAKVQPPAPLAASAASHPHKPVQLAASAAKSQAHPSAAARLALAALNGKQPDQVSNAEVAAATRTQQRFVVQAGAFADNHGAQQLMRKIDTAGYKAFIQQIETHQGKRWRVRVGPFASRPEADKALAHLKTLGVTGAVLGL